MNILCIYKNIKSALSEELKLQFLYKLIYNVWKFLPPEHANIYTVNKIDTCTWEMILGNLFYYSDRWSIGRLQLIYAQFDYMKTIYEEEQNYLIIESSKKLIFRRYADGGFE